MFARDKTDYGELGRTFTDAASEALMESQRGIFKALEKMQSRASHGESLKERYGGLQHFKFATFGLI